MESLEPASQRAQSRIRSAAVIFYLMAVVKVLSLLAAMRPPVNPGAPTTPPPIGGMTAVFAWYSAGIVVCAFIGYHLERRKRWARTAGLIVGGMHIAAFFFVMRIGVMAIITGVLGVMAVGSILVAAALEAVGDENPPEKY